MKLPRWLLVSMLVLSAIVGIGSGAWFWITWPERTIAECRESNDWRRLCDPEVVGWIARYLARSKDDDFQLVRENTTAQRRSIADYLLAREEFDGGRDVAVRYIVERGRIKDIRVQVTSNSWESMKELWRRTGDRPADDFSPDDVAP